MLIATLSQLSDLWSDISHVLFLIGELIIGLVNLLILLILVLICGAVLKAFT